MKHHITLILLVVLVTGCTAEPAIAPTSSPAPTMTASPVLPTATIKPSPTPTKLSERSGLIAFYMNNGSMGGIFVMNAKGNEEPVMLSAHPTSDSKPSWSPDGKKIAFESLRDDVLDKEFMDIYIMDADGSHLTKLTNTDGWYSEPEWSPDGKRILVTSHGPDDENYDLYVMDLINGDTVRLTDDPARDTSASWSPDATQVVFSSNRGGKWNIYTINVETGDTNQLTRDAGDNAHADWSPDGEKILFISNRDGDVEIFVMDADGENPKRVTNFPGPDNNPEWSPDGQYFAFSHGDATFGEIYTSSLDSDSPIRLFENKTKYAGYPTWSANASISDEPVFGPPFCIHDTDGDAKLDTATTNFSMTEPMAYVTFPYRNMDSSLITSIVWDSDKTEKLDLSNGSMAWKYGESGWDTAISGLPPSFLGPGKLTIQLYIGDKLMQEIECEITSSNANEAIDSDHEIATPTLTPPLNLPKNGNLALNQSTSTSSSETSRSSNFAVDGNTSTDWGSGNFPPQWIEIDLGAPATLTEIRLLVTQYPNGNTIHRILARSKDGEFSEIHRFEQFTRTGQWLDFKLEKPLENIQIVRIDTVESPSWVGWVEIEVIGER